MALAEQQDPGRFQSWGVLLNEDGREYLPDRMVSDETGAEMLPAESILRWPDSSERWPDSSEHPEVGGVRPSEMFEKWEPHWSSTFQRYYLWSPKTNAVVWKVTEEMVRDGLKKKKRQRVR